MLAKFESECDDSDLEIALVDTNHETKNFKVEISKLRTQKNALENELKCFRIRNKNLQLRN